MNLQKLLDSLTLEEKIGQLFQPHASLFISNDTELTGPDKALGLSKDDIFLSGSVFSCKNAEEMKAVQKLFLENNKKKIPLMFMHNVVNGYKTIYPIPLGMGATFNPELLEECCIMAANESQVSGVQVTFAPMLDLVRDARWGRVMESTGEDTYLNSVLAKSFTNGFRKKGKTAICLKHFAAYGGAEAGRDYNAVDMSERTLREYYLPAYKASIDAGAEMVMTSFNTINGIPATANSWLLNDILRDEFGFDGILISDFNAIGELIEHGYCEDKKEAAKKAINCNVDIEMMSSSYFKHARELLEEGEITIEQIDAMVMRVLKLKDEMGLFKNPYAFADSTKEKKVFLCKKHRDIARRAAEESCVLVKNNGALPLSKDEKIALVGPFTDCGEILGHWRAIGQPEDTVTIYKGVSKHTYKRNIYLDNACSFIIDDTDESGFKSAKAKMKKADKIVLCIGEHQMYSGEGKSKGHIVIPPTHIRLAEEAKKTDKPVIAVVFAGRPLELEELSNLCDSVLIVWQPGTEGGNAIANLLYGKVNPSGKLSMSFPYSVSQLPLYYNHLSTGRPKEAGDKLPEHPKKMPFTSMYMDLKNEPLYPFGYGLSYSEFEYSNLKLDKTEMSKEDTLTVSVDVTNKGVYDGKETVQLYIRDKFASVARPVKELKGFKKIYLTAGETKNVTFTITEDMLRFYNQKMEYLSETGEFEIMVGKNSNDLIKTNFILK